ncbi:hypothetical protein EC988_003081 [Linderina pennispora]|nr:hypothetical protein EC988_003081 [Linderina pennispora]
MKRTVIKRRRRTPGVGNKKHAKEQRKQTEKAAKAILMMHGRQMPPVPALVPSYRTASAMSEEDVSSNYSSVPSSPQMPVVVIRSDEGMNCGGIQASLGMEYLMKAAELSPPLEPTKRFCEPTFSLLDSLATVATAEIALTKRFPISFGRADVERECERLASINNNTL